MELKEAKAALESAVSDLPQDAQDRYHGSWWKDRNDAVSAIQAGGDPGDVARAYFCDGDPGGRSYTLTESEHATWYGGDAAAHNAQHGVLRERLAPGTEIYDRDGVVVDIVRGDCSGRNHEN